MSDLKTDLLHAIIIIENDRNANEKWAKDSKADNDMDGYNFFHGITGGENFCLNLLHKIATTYGIEPPKKPKTKTAPQLKARTTKPRKLTTKKKN